MPVVMPTNGVSWKQSSQPDFISREVLQYSFMQSPIRHFESVDERWRDRSNVLPRNNESDLRRYRRKMLQRDRSIDTAWKSMSWLRHMQFQDQNDEHSPRKLPFLCVRIKGLSTANVKFSKEKPIIDILGWYFRWLMIFFFMHYSILNISSFCKLLLFEIFSFFYRNLTICSYDHNFFINVGTNVKKFNKKRIANKYSISIINHILSKVLIIDPWYDKRKTHIFA